MTRLARNWGVFQSNFEKGGSMSFSKSLLLAVTLAVAARADFSYTSTRKGSATGQTGEVTKHYLKGQKMMMDMGKSIMLMDFDEQTITTIHTDQKTYSVSKFADLGQTLQQTGAEITADVKETGQHKNINGFDASEVVMTIQMETAQSQKAGMKMQLEMAMVDIQRKMAGLNGVPVLQIVKMKSGGNEAQAAQMQQGMAQARARLEEMQKQGGPQAAAAAQALARMGAASGGSLFETTMESGNFSTSAIPDTVFAIPAGFKKVDK
jgi:hypothetical protein